MKPRSAKDKHLITLTTLKSEPVVLDKADVRVIQELTGNALVTLVDGTQYHVTESTIAILDLLKAKD